MKAKEIVEILGGRETLRRKIDTMPDLREVVRAGLPAGSLTRLMRVYSMTQEEIATNLQIPSRTLSRRIAESGRLMASESEKVVRLARIIALADEVFDNDVEKVTYWLRRRNRALRGETPLSLMDSELGAEQVQEVLGRIQGGVFS